MSESAKNVVDGFRTLRTFCGEVAKMLKAADGMMEDGGWTPTGNRAVSYTSRVIGDPDRWLPTEFFRYYEHEDHTDLLPFVSVLLHDPEPENETVVVEALISGGYVKFEDGSEHALKDWDWVCRSHLFMEDEDGNRKDDGAHYSVNPQKEAWSEKEWIGAVKVNTFAHPLDDIESTEKLSEKIVQPLLDMLPRDE
jgi:hypothetical protein